jgi:hypothetical protein
MLVASVTTPAQADDGLTRLSWSANIGRIANIGPWVRNVNYSMTPSTATSGTVGAYFAQYDPTVAGTKTVIGYAGPCNGVDRCPIYTATSSASGTWTGSYTFSGTDNTGQLTITWSNGGTEVWQLSQLRNNTLGQMTLVSAAWPGSDPNGGTGYGSKQPFSYYKTMGQVDSVTDLYVGTSDVIVEGSTAQYDIPWNMNVGGMNGSTAYPKGLYLLQSPNTTYPLCGEAFDHIKGTIYMMYVTNGGRLMAQNNWRRCLVQAETGYYSGDLHVGMLNQVIDDSKNMVGVVGVESSASGGWTVARVNAIKP